MKTPEFSRLTRSEFLRAAGGAAAGLLLIGPDAARARTFPPGVWGRPPGPLSRSELDPPQASVMSGPAAASGAHDGYWFITAGSGAEVQTGPLILDDQGRPVWFKRMPRGWYAFNLRAQTYRAEPVLTWWEGTVFGLGEGVIMDSTYREIARVRAGNGHQVDPHEFLLTPEGTALITASPSPVNADLSSVGGSRQGLAWESVIQEVDVATGRVLLEWRSLEEVGVEESYMWAGHGIYDYLHANSIDLTPDGNLLVSGRHTWALYKLGRDTGRVIWRLGGKRSDFAMGPRAQFAWQHDGRQGDEQTITVFDDGAAFFEGNHRFRSTHSQSRGLALSVDHGARKVTVRRSYRHHPPLLAGGYGNMQTLPDGGVVVGWGNLPMFSQYTAAGVLVQQLNIPVVDVSYRGYRLPWTGVPAEPPVVRTRRRRDGRGATVYASWNGATECAAWRVRAGVEPSRLRTIATQSRTGFETAIDVGVRTGYVDAIALDSAGRALGRSQPVRL
jgi:hypothetical protein